jgi:transposase
MAHNFIPCDRDQALLLPPDLREWLPVGHLAWFVIEAVEDLDLEPFYAEYRSDGWGAAAHDPQMMVALTLYSYAVGTRSSRQIERRCHEDVGFRVVSANQAPDHTTIARFRNRHEQALGDLFTDVLGLCAKAGLVDTVTLALDSTKLAANASGRANLTYEQIARTILREAAEIDAQEDALYGERRGDELPEHLRDSRARREWLRKARRELKQEQAARGPQGSRPKRLAEAKRRLEEDHALESRAIEGHQAARAHKQREHASAGRKMPGRPPIKALEAPPTPTGRMNVTDPDSRSVRTPRGFIQGYSAQAAATEGQIVVCAEVTIGGADQGLLEPLAGKALAELGAIGARPPTTLLADAGYWNSRQLAALREQGIDVLVPPEAEDRRGPPQMKNPLARDLRARLETDEGRALYRKRQRIIEPVFGHTKANRRMDRFLRRGVAACRSEWRLITATHNLTKLWRHKMAVA